MIAISISQILIICGIYFVLPYGKQPDIEWWLGTGFNRMLLPGISVLWMGLSMFLKSATTEDQANMITRQIKISGSPTFT